MMKLPHAIYGVLALLIHFNQASTAQDSLIVDVNQIISSNDTFDYVIIKAGAFLTLDAILVVNQKMIVESDGVINHSVRYEPGLEIQVGDSLIIQPNGRINVIARGMRGVSV